MADFLCHKKTSTNFLTNKREEEKEQPGTGKRKKFTQHSWRVEVNLTAMSSQSIIQYIDEAGGPQQLL
jgi:hypothetical protein